MWHLPRICAICGPARRQPSGNRPRTRSLVQFKRLNLQGDWPMQRPFQVIFCRNVMIYFDQPTKERW
jgi:chemotaxis methyl-accepting protein methylase